MPAYEKGNRPNPALLVFGCCACVCMSVVLGLLIATLVKVNHLEDKIAMPVMAAAATAISAGADLAANQSPHGVRNALLRHNIAGLKQGTENRNPRAAEVARDPEQPPGRGPPGQQPVHEQQPEQKPVHELSLAERIARAKQMSNRQRNVAPQ